MPRRLGLFSVAAAILPACGVTEPEPPLEPIAHDTVPPEVRISHPRTNALLFHRAIGVTVDAIDDQVIEEVALAVDGHPVASDQEAPWEFVWQTDSLPQGDYVLQATAYDTARNEAVHEVAVRLRDIVLITEIEVTATYDAVFGEAIELEAHLYDDGAGSFLGCSGADSGLRDADLSNQLYTVEAYFVRPPLGVDVLLYDDVVQLNLRLEITEDDADACPVPAHTGADPNFDDLVGTSATFPGSQLATPIIMGFDNVVHLAISRGRLSVAPVPLVAAPADLARRGEP